MTAEIELLPVYMAASISLTAVVAVLAGINIALVAYNIKTQRARNMKKNGTSAILGGALTAFTAAQQLTHSQPRLQRLNVSDRRR